MDNRPYGAWDEKLYEMAFPAGHPYHHPVIGYMEDLDNATLADVEAFFRSHYTPSNAVLTIAGGFEPRRARALVERYFGPIPGGKRPKPRPVPGARPASGAEAVVRDSVALPRLYLLIHAPAPGEAAYHDAEAAAYFLGDGRGSLLYRELVMEGRTASAASAWFLPAEGVSSLVLCVTGQPGVSLKVLRTAFLRTLEGAGRRPLEAPETRRARHLNLAAAVLQEESLTQRADLLSEASIRFDDPGAALEQREGRERVSRDSLQAYLRRALEQPRFLLGFVPRP